MTRPSFIRSAFDESELENRYPDREEVFSYSRPFGKLAGLEKIGLHWERLPPGHRSSLPHAEEQEEEFVVVLEGEVQAWIDGVKYALVRGDIAAFPSGTGIAHTFINESNADAILLVGGERSKADNRIVYPLDPWRRAQMSAGAWWDDAPTRSLGDSPPVAQRVGKARDER